MRVYFESWWEGHRVILADHDFSLDERGLKDARSSAIVPTHAPVAMLAEINDTPPCDCAFVPRVLTTILRRCKNVIKIALGRGFVPIFHDTLVALARCNRRFRGTIDISEIAPVADLLQQTGAWTVDEWARVIDVLGNQIEVIPLVEYAALQKTLPALAHHIHTALVPRDHTAYVAGVEIIETRVMTEDTTHELVLRRARGAALMLIATSGAAWMWALFGCRILPPYVIAVAGERLDLNRTLEEYGVDDDTAVNLS